jgi:pimeloyl-ACP methyl ester carboxylesterase
MNSSSLRAARWAVSAIAWVAIGLRLPAAETSPKQTSSRPETFVYVHGAWNGSYGLQKIERLLRAAGHEVYRPALTGLGERVHLAHADISLDTHIQDIVNVIVWEDLRDVVLVGRSYGGMVIAGVIDRVPERIRRAIYLDAFLPADGESLLEISPQRVGVQDDGFVAIPPPIRPAVGKAPPHPVPQPGKTFSQKLRLRNPDAAARIPTTYLLTVEAGKRPEEDPFFKFAERARARGWKVAVMEADHGPEISRPEALLPLLTTP